jgi:hypothetical protein
LYHLVLVLDLHLQWNLLRTKQRHQHQHHPPKKRTTHRPHRSLHRRQQLLRRILYRQHMMRMMVLRLDLTILTTDLPPQALQLRRTFRMTIIHNILPRKRHRWDTSSFYFGRLYVSFIFSLLYLELMCC